MSRGQGLFVGTIVFVLMGALACRDSGPTDLEKRLGRIEERTTRLTEAVKALSDAAEELGKLVPEMRLAAVDVTLLRTGMMLTPLIPSPSRAGQTAIVIGPVERNADPKGATEAKCQVVFAGFSKADTDMLSREDLMTICMAIFSSFKAGYLVYFPEDAGASFELTLFYMDSAKGPIQFARYSPDKGLIRG
jgi:hypothetical protein